MDLNYYLIQRFSYLFKNHAWGMANDGQGGTPPCRIYHLNMPSGQNIQLTYNSDHRVIYENSLSTKGLH